MTAEELHKKMHFGDCPHWGKLDAPVRRADECFECWAAEIHAAEKAAVEAHDQELMEATPKELIDLAWGLTKDAETAATGHEDEMDDEDRGALYQVMLGKIERFVQGAVDASQHESNWIREKLGLPADASTGDVQGEMHIMAHHAHGYMTYIEAYRCNDKQGEIARLTVERNKANDRAETAVEAEREALLKAPCPPVRSIIESLSGWGFYKQAWDDFKAAIRERQRGERGG